MTRKYARLIVGTAGIILGAAILTGCQSGTVANNHQMAVDNANQRWRDMRSKLLLQMGQRQFDTGDLDQAEKTTADALTIDPSNAQLQLLAGRIALERGQLEKAHNLFQTAIASRDSLPEPHYYRGVVLQRWQQYEPALGAYQRAYELKPQEAAYLLATTEMLVALDRLDEAANLLTGKLSYFDQNAGVRLALAQISMIRKDYAQAAEYYRQASLLKPDDLAIVQDLALAQIAAGRQDQAVGGLERLVQQPEYAKRADTLQLLAAAYEATGRLPSAKEVYVRLTRSHPDNVDAWLKLASLCWTLDDLRGAELAAGRAITLAPKRHEGYVLAGLTAQKAGRLPEAIAQLGKASELAPERSQPMVLRGLALEQAGQTTAAAKVYQEVLTRHPEDAQAKKLLARLTTESAQP